MTSLRNALKPFNEREQRKFPRASARVIYAVIGEEYVGTAVYTKDISAGGMCFVGGDPVEADTIVSLFITLPGGASFEARGRVVRKEEIRVHWTAKEQYKVAIEFTDIGQDARQVVAGFVEKSRMSPFV